jgi:glycosyltransferase involved in cell wall biosynthesis
MIVNATNVGRNLSGIGRYSLCISKFLSKHWELPLELILNNQGSAHFNKYASDSRVKIKTGLMSPDYGFKGHLLRLLHSNKLSFSNPNDILFTTSQLEGSLFSKRQIIAVQDCIPYVFPQYHKKQYYFFKYILPTILKRSIRIITCSNFSKNSIMELYKIPEQKISVIYNGINQINLGDNLNTRKKDYILYVGRSSPMKNLDRLIKAFKIITNKYNIGLKLILTCQKSDVPLDLIKGLEKYIEFAGYVSEDQLAKLYQEALLFAFPSLYEGFGFPPLEAMSHGCPTLVSNAASLPEVCGDAAYFVDPYDEESIADGIYQVATDSALRKTLIQKGLERAKLFAWEETGKKHIQIFKEILNNS